MTGPIRGLSAIIPTLALLCVLTACSDQLGGQPAPISADPSSSSATGGDNPLAGMNPCATLDRALTGQGFPAAAPTAADPEHSCATDKPQTGGLTLQLQDGRAINENLTDPSKTQTGRVHDRAAILEPGILGTDGGCSVIMEVKPKSRAIVTGSLSTGTTDQACTFTRTAAEAVEPLLPKNR
ncbi:hypothetical protein [Amycolatopsis sp. PS_44_ISF1]|uniref:hypothetical protein n=1 Tax=Amycolatopsis sp. PS_44_ISF1 TaxID=2974917 RepID=UPI0028DD871D|nr:hypothetical protein [Amycolatopsis sp. PS_44_ISF1]MDT8911150.1 hypothetical protein [Amycolatopsis sp. PS_44_ISF1]